jgi:DNA polymerase (family 10)
MQAENDNDAPSLRPCPWPATHDRLAHLHNEGGGLISPCDVRGLLHCHSHYCDGAHSLRAMVETARSLGLEYLGVSDHIRTDRHLEGLDRTAVARQREEIEALNERFPDFDLLHGVELDLAPDGEIPLDEEGLSCFDYVIVSLDGDHDLTPAQRTEQVVGAIMNPFTTIISRPIAQYMLARPPAPIEMESVLRAAAEAGAALEFDAIPGSLDPDWTYCHRAQELGVMLSINPNAHRAARLVDYRHGVELTRKAGLCFRQILNTFTRDELRIFLNRQR